jgi:crotonobetainyl-CoA:carnitine CoA-transferase CaiB-like acyl-CoA transferase
MQSPFPCIRAANGEGRYIDVSMLEAMVAEALQAHRSPGRFGNQNPMRVPADA